MTTKQKAFLVFVLIGCIALLVIAPTGLIERELLQFADWWQYGSYMWGFWISVVAFSVSAASINAAARLARTNEKLHKSVDEALAELREQRRTIESLDANFGRILNICADNRAALSGVDERISALADTLSTIDEVEGKTTRSRISVC